MITLDMIREARRRLTSTAGLSVCQGFGCTRPTREPLCLRCALYGSPGVPGIIPWEPDPEVAVVTPFDR